MTHLDVTWEPARYAGWRVFVAGQLVGVLSFVRNRGYVSTKDCGMTYDLRDAVMRYVERFGMNEPAWFERTVKPRGADLMDEDDMALPKTKKLPTQLAGNMIRTDPDAQDCEFDDKLLADKGIPWLSILRFCRSGTWKAGPVAELYTDGGLTGQNGSAAAGTWAYCGVDAEGRLACVDSGVMTAEQLKLRDVSNNASEIGAIIKALVAVPLGWTGRLNSDSKVALGWLVGGDQDQSEYTPPAVLLPFILRCREKVRQNNITVRLIKGHASQDHLDLGRHPDTGYDTSPWNNLCDLLCTARSIEWKANRNQEAA